ncbi:MAG: NAD(P)H-binding protein, partial [Silicimonas sp.]|nr:NAD(P)H-binding protein [Silicimonas sp.]
LPDALAGADVVIDASITPPSENTNALDFFATAGRNVARTAADARLTHYLALSIVGAEQLVGEYFKAKIEKEQLVRAAGIRFTILRSTQFFEFVCEAATQLLSAKGDARRVAADPAALYFGEVLGRETLVPSSRARIFGQTLREWVSGQPIQITQQWYA